MAKKRKPPIDRPARAPKRASERKGRILSFGVDKSRLKAYQDAAAIGFEGEISDFLRAAADDLAGRLLATEKQLKRERGAFRSAAADAPEQFERER
jgi:hypothetical protein